MLSRFINECLNNQEHGLDCYLSMRIRHGTLSGQLRGALEDEKLITPKISEEEGYLDNDYWENKLYQRASGECISSILSILNRNSEKIDEFIRHIANDLIQVKSEEKPDGLFFPKVYTFELLEFASSITEETRFEHFVKKCFEMFWIALEEDLKNVRGKINKELKGRLQKIFQELERDLAEAAGAEGIRISDLNDTVRRCRTKAQVDLERVRDWFVRPRPPQSVDMSMGELIDVGLETVKVLHSGFEPILIKNIKELDHMRNAMALFSDIFFIVFENIHLHSGNGRNPKVWIDASLEGDGIFVRVENEVPGDLATNEVIISRLAAIRSRLEAGLYRRAIPKEGGTGILKLRKLIGNPKSGEPNLNFGLDEEKFFVEFSVDLVGTLSADLAEPIEERGGREAFIGRG